MALLQTNNGGGIGWTEASSKEAFIPRALSGSDLLDCRLEHTPDYVHLEFNTPRPVLSSAILNGGLNQITQLLNLKVPANTNEQYEKPELFLSRFIEQHGWAGEAVGMMTAASMKSLRVQSETIEGEQVAVLVTTGLANARRAGEPAEYRHLMDSVAELGTINAVVLTSAMMTPAAMVEALMIASEAKAAVMQQAGVRSKVSGAIATGTGTDAMAVVSGHDGPSAKRRGALVSFAGKHTLFGETVAQLMMNCIADSIAYDQEKERVLKCE